MKKNITIFVLILTVIIILVFGWFTFMPPYFRNQNFSFSNKQADQSKPLTYTSEEQSQYIKSTCHFTIDCVGSTKTECLKDWLLKSKCFSKSYIDEHFSNFILKLGSIPTDDKVYFDYKFQDNLVSTFNGHSNSKGEARIVGEPNHFKVLGYIGPLKEYRLAKTREEAITEAQRSDYCTVSTQTTESVRSYSYLVIEDQFYGEGTEDISDSSRFKFDARGLRWKIPNNECVRSCEVDALTGKLYQTRIFCY